MKFPLDEASREAIRMEYLEEEILKAHRRAARFMVSARCQDGRHKRCFDDGVHCICRHHDQRGELQ